MSEYLVNIQIKRMEEDGRIYYLATSDDIQGLVVQADTLSEAIKEAECSVKDLIEIHKELGNPLPVVRMVEKSVKARNLNIPLAVPC
ncbi:MAG: hypothetical protein MSIBF_02010 [Candidatus Altiarchaeales archaeon IMC4]|nr:MAG: hypothetical protein MSIBF_02010 [Candidatus Altiarchaeales archaeon IMC4]